MTGLKLIHISKCGPWRLQLSPNIVARHILTHWPLRNLNEILICNFQKDLGD